MTTALDRAIEACGGVEGLADKAGVGRSTTYLWKAGKLRISAEHAVRVETATAGKVSRAELRPDLFATAVMAQDFHDRA